MPEVSHIQRAQWAMIKTGNIPDNNIQALQNLVDQGARLSGCNGYADGTSVWNAMEQEVQKNNAVLAPIFQQLKPPGGREFTIETAQIHLRSRDPGELIHIGTDITANEGEVVSISPEQYAEGTATYSVRIIVPTGYQDPGTEKVFEVECRSGRSSSTSTSSVSPSPIDTSKSWDEFGELLQDDSISDESWMSHMGLSTQEVSDLKVFYDYDKKVNAQLPQRTEPPLLYSSRSACDIYFFGASSSGKSCILASMIRAIREGGAMTVNKNLGLADNEGNLYQNYMLRCLRLNCLPKSTSTQVALAMPVEVLHDPQAAAKSTAHSWNFIEMAGERVKANFENGNTDDINVHGWMKNDNHKVLNFVIDPEYRPSAANPYEQDSMMDSVHKAMGELQVYEKTIHVNIILNKFDLIAAEEGYRRDDWDVEAQNYVREKYSTLMNAIKQQSIKKRTIVPDKEKFEVHVIPFSIGNDFGFGRYVFKWDDSPTSPPNKMVELLRSNTPHG